MFVALKAVSLLGVKAIAYPVMIPLWIVYQVGRLGVKVAKHPLKAAMKIGAFPFLATWWTMKGVYNLTADTLKDWRSFLLMPIGVATAVRVAHNRRKSPDEPSILFGILATGIPAVLAGFVSAHADTLKPMVMGLVSSLMADPRSFTSLPMIQQAGIAFVASQILSVLFELSRAGKMSMFGDKKQNVPNAIEMKPVNSIREPHDYLTMFNWITDRKQLTEIEGKQATVRVAYLLANGVITNIDSDDFRKRINDRLPTLTVCG
ncbi:MAG: hypothetical protein AAB389_04915 [Patescibacteria group bacterium]